MFLLVVTGVLYFRGDLSKVEESYRYYDPEEHKAFMEMLKVEGIPFRVGPGGAVFYAVEYRGQVKEVSAQCATTGLGRWVQHKITSLNVPNECYIVWLKPRLWRRSKCAKAAVNVVKFSSSSLENP